MKFKQLISNKLSFVYLIYMNCWIYISFLKIQYHAISQINLIGVFGLFKSSSDRYLAKLTNCTIRSHNRLPDAMKYKIEYIFSLESRSSYFLVLNTLLITFTRTTWNNKERFNPFYRYENKSLNFLSSINWLIKMGGDGDGKLKAAVIE